MSSIQESLSTLKNVFFSTRRMKLFIIWLLIAIFFQFISIFGSRDEFMLNESAFIFNLIISSILEQQITVKTINNALMFSFTFIKNQTNAIVIFISLMGCGLSTLIFWIVREGLKEKVENWDKKPALKFILFGSLGAIWVEFIFWLFEKLFNTVGVAASPNLLLDLIVTMPWYITMVALVWIIHKRYSYTLVEIAFLGGFYEFISPDGVMGAIFSGQFANLILLPAMIPMYVFVYSYIILPPTILTRKEIEKENSTYMDRRSNRRFLYGMIPLLGLIPYAIILPMIG